ncbi:MAG: alpha/beta fold hydrolase [Hyphomicrobiales bacterium]|nr:alpha/beta fold hydrolase [Hyphomicrobiales bacterium]
MTCFVTAPDGVEIAYETEGEGPPLVLLHGLAGDRQTWRAFGLAERLLQMGRRVILIDARGHGASEKPYNVEAYADHKRAADVVVVLDALSVTSADLCGYSMGGWIAMSVAAFHPQRCRSLTAIAAHGYAQSLSAFRHALGDDMNGWIAHIETAGGRRLNQTLKDQLLRNDIDSLWSSVAADRTDLSGDVADARCPSLLICGDRDPLWPDIARFGRWISGWTVTLPGRDHFTAIGATGEIALALASFLAFVDQVQSDPAHPRYRPKRPLMADMPMIVQTGPRRSDAA